MIKRIFVFCVLISLLAGCSSQTEDNLDEKAEVKEEIPTEMSEMSEAHKTVPSSELTEEATENSAKESLPKTEQVKEIDLSRYFEGLNGCAVFYNPEQEGEEYLIYNKELSQFPSSPCSTFKIASLLMGLEDQVITPEDSLMEWNQTQYWKEDWNRDLDYKEAFQTSCVWYFRELINRLGKEKVQDTLEELKYGNCDISDWEGKLNLNNSNRDLTGFWIESSLRISPKVQTEVLNRIFGADSSYTKENIGLLKEVMYTDHGDSLISIYGKTGMGVKDGQCIDAWFVGMFEVNERNTYFAVRLDDPEKEIVSSKKAKEIAIRIIDDYFAKELKIS